MNSREIERLEAEAAAQRRQLYKSWDDLQGAVRAAPPRQSRRFRSHSPIVEGSTRLLFDLCLLAVTVAVLLSCTAAPRQAGIENHSHRGASRTSQKELKHGKPRRD